MAEKRPALGRGLSALIPDAPAAPQPSPRPHRGRHRSADAESLPAAHGDGRRRIDELARSIRANGIIQPIVVRKAGDGYEIIAGERRWRAAQRAGLLKVPVVVRDMPDDQLLAVALIENIQREDLNPIEEAQAYRRLADELQLTQEQIADAVGKDRSSIANYAAAAAAAAEMRDEVAAGALAMGHARALLGLPDEAAQRRVGREVVARRLVGARDRSARQEVARARRRSAPSRRRTSTPARPKRSSASRSAPACASSERAPAAESKSTSRSEERAAAALRTA